MRLSLGIIKSLDPTFIVNLRTGYRTLNVFRPRGVDLIAYLNVYNDCGSLERTLPEVAHSQQF